MQRLKVLLLLAISVLSLSGCVSVGREFPIQPVQQIEIGVTTQADLQRMFGKPWRTGVEDGKRTWTYAEYYYSLIGPAKTRDLVIRFDSRGVVASYTFNSTYPEDELK